MWEGVGEAMSVILLLWSPAQGDIDIPDIIMSTTLDL